MHGCKLVMELVAGLNKAHRSGGATHVNAIAKQAGVNPSTVAKIRSGETTRVQTPTTERLLCVLAHHKHVSAVFELPVEQTMTRGGRKNAA